MSDDSLDAAGRLTDRLFGTDAMAAVWSTRATLQRMLDVEAALARAEAAEGVIPAAAVAAIAAACRAERLDAQALARDAARGGNLAIPLVRQLTALVKGDDPEAAKYVHWGATSQDVIDTGIVLQLRDALALIEADLDAACRTLADLARQHRQTPLIGRTWLQHALPITLGLKFAQWLDALLRHRERLRALRTRTGVLQFGGAAGTLASLGTAGAAVTRRLAAELALAEPAVPWHSEGDRLAEAGTVLGLLTGTLGKIARDISLQMQTEVGELAEPAGAGKGGSSTMPHKRNPVGCAAVLGAATRVPGLVATLLSGMIQEHERALGGWQAAWDSLADIARLSAGALANIGEVLAGLEVDEARMAANLGLTHGLIFGEAVMLALGATLGRLEAHHLVERASRQALQAGQTLHAVLAQDPQVTACLDPERLAALFEPSAYTGRAGEYIDNVLAGYAGQEN